MSDNQYQKRFVIFLDLLGFKNASIEMSCKEILSILKTFHNEAVRNNFYDILLHEQRRDDGSVYLDLNLKDGDLTHGKICGDDFRCSFFSDSAIISIDPSHLTTRNNVLTLCKSLQFQLLLKKILVRGGIAYGDLYHEADIAFGPALIDAIQVEQIIGIPMIGLHENSCHGLIKDFGDMLSRIIIKDNEQISVVNFAKDASLQYLSNDYNKIENFLRDELELTNIKINNIATKTSEEYIQKLRVLKKLEFLFHFINDNKNYFKK